MDKEKMIEILKSFSSEAEMVKGGMIYDVIPEHSFEDVCDEILKTEKTVEAKELGKIEQAQFEEAVKICGQILTAAMKVLNIPNFIEATFEVKGDKYKLRFDKTKKL